MTKDTPPPQLDAATEAELDRIIRDIGKTYALADRQANTATRPKTIQDAEQMIAGINMVAKAALTRLLLLQRVEQLQRIYHSIYSDIYVTGDEKVWACLQFIEKQITAIQAQLEKEGQSE